MASISQNQYDYLSNLAKAGGGNGEWAKSQLNGATVYAPPASTPSSSVFKSTPTPTPTATPYSQGNNYASVPAPAATTQVGSTYKGPGSPFIQTPAPAQTTQTPYSQGNNYGTVYYPGMNSSQSAITQQAKPQTDQSGQTQLPPWMGGYYSQVPGTNYYSTNPSNPNASKYYADGSPVASMGYSDGNGFSFDGYGTPEIFQQVMKLANVPNGAGLSGVGDVYKSGIASGQLTPNSAIYNSSGGYANRPPTAEEAKAGSGILNSSSGTVFAPQGATTNVPKLSGTQQSATDWINNTTSGMGGIANYIKTQQAKWDNAVMFGDTAMQQKLKDDMARVGYSLNTSNAVQSGSSGQGGVQGGQTGTINNGSTVLAGGRVTSDAKNNPWDIPNDEFNGLGSQADAQLKSIRDGITQAISAATTTLKNNYDYTNQLTKDKRALEDFHFEQKNDPFSGGTSYRRSMLDRDRSIADTASSKDYNAQIAALQQKLSDFDSGSATQKQAIVSQLAKELASMHMQEAGITGMYNGQKTASQLNADRTFDITKSGVTGYYQDSNNVESVKKLMAANSAAYGSASPAEQKRLHDENVKLAALIGGEDTTGNGDYSFGQGTRTMAGRASDLNETQTMAVLTGHLPNGQPTNSKQQQDLENQWKVAEQTGMIPNVLADYYGLPRGMQTQAAKTQAAQLAISKMNADNSARSTTASINNMNADNTRTDNAVKLSENQREIEGEVYNHAQEFKSMQDVNDYFSANGAYLATNLGAAGANKLKQSFLDQFTPGKSSTSNRKEAIDLAQKDYRWNVKSTDKAALIKEYEAMLNGQ